jgi:hypothetical protein
LRFILSRWAADIDEDDEGGDWLAFVFISALWLGGGGAWKGCRAAAKDSFSRFLMSAASLLRFILARCAADIDDADDEEEEDMLALAFILDCVLLSSSIALSFFPSSCHNSSSKPSSSEESSIMLISSCSS